MSDNPVCDVMALREILPHRYPFALIDKIVECVDHERIVAIKNVTINEPFFQGHFPDYPVMPGVLILEAMAQAGAVLARMSPGGMNADKTIFLVGANNVKWKRQVVPGDTLRIEMTSVKRKKPMWIMDGEVTVDGTLVASGRISAVES